MSGQVIIAKRLIGTGKVDFDSKDKAHGLTPLSMLLH
jgi:hypothetical protein